MGFFCRVFFEMDAVEALFLIVFNFLCAMCRNLFRGFASLLCVICAVEVFAWGQKGHDVTAAIAENHFTPATAAAVSEIFEGMSPVYWANWLDNASHTAEYAYSKPWHYKNVDSGRSYFTTKPHPDGDVVTALRYNIRVLADTSATASDKSLALKMLVHLMGDLHQPMHMGRAADYGGNTVKVKYFGRDTNLHSVWDTSLLESAHRWSFTEWRDQLDRVPQGERQVVVSGNIDDWAQQAVAIADGIYQKTPGGKSLSYDEVAFWAPVIEEQLVKGGLRLAHVLNSIFDPGYEGARVPSTF